MVKRKASSSGPVSPANMLSRHSNDTDNHDDPTSRWSIQAGVRRGTAFAGTREKVRMAEARGAAERGDHSGSSGEKTVRPSKRRDQSVCSTEEAAMSYAKQRAAYQKQLLSMTHHKDKAVGETRTRGNDKAGETTTMTSTTSTARTVQPHTTAKYTQRDLVAAVAALTAKTTVPSPGRTGRKKSTLPKSPTTLLLQQASSVHTDQSSRSDHDPQTHPTTTAMKSASNVRKKRKADLPPTGSILEVNERGPPTRADLENGGNDSDSDASSWGSTDSQGRPHKMARKEDNLRHMQGGMIQFNISKRSPILTLIEGITYLQPRNSHHTASTRPSMSMEEYRQKIARRDWPDEFPPTGSPQQLPATCLRGRWQAEWKIETEAQHGHGGDKYSLSRYRLCLRHASRLGMGPLPFALCDENATAVHGKGDTTDSSDHVKVSCMIPLKKRSPDLLSRMEQTSRDDNAKKDHHIFIGSIGLVGRKGFHFPSETTSKASGMGHHVLEHIKHEDLAVDDDDDDDDDDSSIESEFSGLPPMVPVTETGAEGCVGVSIPCGLPLDSKYHLRFAQDQSLENNPIVAVDVIFNENISETSPSDSGPPVQAKEARKVPTPISDEDSKHLRQTAGYIDAMDTVRKEDAPPKKLQSIPCQYRDRSSKKKAAMAAPVKGHREKIPENRYNLPSSSSEDEDVPSRNHDFSPTSKDSWATNPKLRVPTSMVPHQNDRMSAHRPKSLVHKFDEEASRDSGEAEHSSSNIDKAPIKETKKVRLKLRPSEIFDKNRTTRKNKITLPSTKSFDHPRPLPQKVKQEIESRRMSFNSPLGKDSGKRKASRTSKFVPRTPPGKTEAIQTQTPDTYASWSDDWGYNSGHDSDFEDDNKCVDLKGAAMVEKTDKWSQQEQIPDAGLLESKEDETKLEEQNEKNSMETDDETSTHKFVERVETCARFENLSRPIPRTGKRRWFPVATLLLALGGTCKEPVPPHSAITGLMRQKKHSLPSPIRLTNRNPKSFSLKSTTW